MFRERERRSRCVNLAFPCDRYRSALVDNSVVRGSNTRLRLRPFQTANSSRSVLPIRRVCYVSIVESLSYLQKIPRISRGQVESFSTARNCLSRSFFKTWIFGAKKRQSHERLCPIKINLPLERITIDLRNSSADPAPVFAERSYERRPELQDLWPAFYKRPYRAFAKRY